MITNSQRTSRAGNSCCACSDDAGGYRTCAILTSALPAFVCGSWLQRRCCRLYVSPPLLWKPGGTVITVMWSYLLSMIKQHYKRPQTWPWLTAPTAQPDGGPIDSRMCALLMNCPGQRPGGHDVWRLLAERLCSPSFGFINDEEFYYRWMHALQSRLQWPPHANTWQPEYGLYNGIKA